MGLKRNENKCLTPQPRVYLDLTIGREGGKNKNCAVLEHPRWHPYPGLAGGGSHPRRANRCYPTAQFVADFQNKTLFSTLDTFEKMAALF